MSSSAKSNKSSSYTGVDISHLPSSAIHTTISRMPSGDLASHIYNQVVAIINKQPEDRTETEIGRILPWFRKKSDLFKPLKNGKLFFLRFLHYSAVSHMFMSICAVIILGNILTLFFFKYINILYELRRINLSLLIDRVSVLSSPLLRWKWFLNYLNADKSFQQMKFAESL